MKYAEFCAGVGGFRLGIEQSSLNAELIYSNEIDNNCEKTYKHNFQRGFQRFISEHGFCEVLNCFIMPTEQISVIDKGEVSLKMLDDLGLQRIKVRLLPAEIAYRHYLLGTRMNIADLHLNNSMAIS